MVNTTSQSRHIHTSAHALCSQAVTAVAAATTLRTSSGDWSRRAERARRRSSRPTARPHTVNTGSASAEYHCSTSSDVISGGAPRATTTVPAIRSW